MGFASIITDDTESCFVCGRKGRIQKHHAIHGTGRKALADAYNLVIPLCPECHAELHDRNPQLDKWVQAKAQEAFEQYYPDKSFLKIFGKNYK